VNDNISILYAGCRESKVMAFKVHAYLLEKGLDDNKINNYQVDYYGANEMNYLDKVNTYITKVSKDNKIVIILSKKYLTESIFCQEEIRGVVSKFENHFRGNVFVIFANKDIEKKITDEAENEEIKNEAHQLIEEYKEKLQNANIRKERLSEINYCITTIKIFLTEIRSKRDFVYKKDDIEKLVEDVLQDIIPFQVKKNNSTELEDFLAMFNKCFSDEAFDEYGDSLDITKGLNRDLLKVNNIYKKCMLPESENINIVTLINRQKLKLEDINEDINNYITLKFYKKYYLMPKAIQYELLTNGDINEGYELDSEIFVEDLKENLDAGELIYLIGGVGEGKSTFIKKIIYDLHTEKNEDYKFIYYKFNGKDSIDTIFETLKTNIERQKRNILFIDELDSFSHVYERFMFTTEGYDSFKEQIKKIKSIIEKLKELHSEDEVQSILVSVRPYVLSHFKKNTLIHLNRTGKIYKLLYSDDIGEKIIRKRIQLFKDIITDIQNSNNIKQGTKDIILRYKNEIIIHMDERLFEMLPNGKIRQHVIQNGDKNIYVPIPKKHDPVNKLLKLSTHGFRTLLTLYHDLGYNPKLYHSYFSNTIFLYYVLGLYKKYSQILPQKYNEYPKENYTGKIFNYPNMYLSIASSETNKEISCANPHTITYWLKIFLLDFINKNDRVSINRIIEEFNDFNKGLVLIALGSLGTINEYNCIEYDFPTSNDNDLETFLSRTKAKLTRRGYEIISNDRYLDYNNLEFFIDDWQLPKPKIEVILGKNYKDKDFFTLIKRLTDQNFTYEHLVLDNDEDFIFGDFILDKTRLIIWYTYIFEVALKKEKQFYRINFFNRNENFFQEKRKKIQAEANAIFRSHYPSAERDLTIILNKFDIQCRQTTSLIDNFFDEVFEKEIKVSCFKC